MKRIMNRIWLNLVKQKGRMILKCIVFLLFFTMLFTSVYINHVSKQLENNILSNYDIYVEISSRLGKIEDAQEYFKASKHYVDMYNDLSQDENVSYSDLGILSYPQSFVQTLKYDDSTGNIQYYTNATGQGMMEDYLKWEEEFKENAKGIYNLGGTQYIKSVRSMIPSDFQFTVTNIIQGRSFTQEEIDEGKPVCLIPVGYRYYEVPTGKMNGSIRIGDKIPISVFIRDKNQVYFYKEIEFEIIGLYQLREDLHDRDIIHEGTSYDYVYIPEKQFKNLYDMATQEVLKVDGYKYYESRYDEVLNEDTKILPSFHSYSLKSMIFKFDNIDKLEGFLEHLDDYKNYFPNTYYYYSTVDNMYQSISNVLSVSKSIQYISFICLIICIAISIMILLFDMNARKKEIGILLSMGESIKGIIVQFILELLIVSFLASVGSYVVTQEVSDVCVDYLIETQVNADIVDTFMPEGYEMDTDVYNEILNPVPLNKSAPVMVTYLGLICSIEVLCMIYMIMKIDPKELLKDE